VPLPLQFRDRKAWCNPQVICPTGNLLTRVSSPLFKKIPLRRRPKSVLEVSPSCPERGALAIVTNVGMGCGGRGSVGRAMKSQGRLRLVSDRRARRRTMKSRTVKPCGPGTRCWCQVGGGLASPTGSRKTFNPPMMVTKRIRRRGARNKPLKPLCTECRMIPVNLW
jgi:hypothetical protein